jgi:hypothetical protein
MLNRVSRTEAEASDAFRRLEDHLRTVTAAGWIPPSAANPKTTAP